MAHKLVIVDDAPFIREIIKGLVHSFLSLEVVGEASEGKKAIEVVRQTHPDIVLMDLVMPNMNGLDVMQEISSDFINTKFIVCSTLDESMIQDKRNYHAYLAKPFTRQSLLETLCNALEVNL